jgi:hypothetical protein
MAVKKADRRNGRPLLVEILCVFGFVSLFLALVSNSIFFFFRDLFIQIPGFAEIPIWSFYFGFLTILLDLIFLIYIWKMKRWALFAYSTIILINVIVNYFLMGERAFSGYGLYSLISPIVFVGLFYIKYKSFK